MEGECPGSQVFPVQQFTPHTQGALVYHGERGCMKMGCRNKAYWELDGAYLCGVHARDKERRHPLPKLSRGEKEERKATTHMAENVAIEEAAEQNRRAGRRGQVRVTKMQMRKAVPDLPGFRKVFPNFKHGGRTDGLGFNTLSPMFLGPVEHGQPGLPPALNIENFHQGSKCFKEETRGTNDTYPGPLFYHNRETWYRDPIPHRHKYKGTKENLDGGTTSSPGVASNRRNIPLYFVWVDKEGKENYLDYVLSRQFYCTFYERLATKQPQFSELQRLLDNGYNLQICGYDGREVTRSLEAEYLDPSQPFGHELVLYSLLVLEPKDYPWKKYTTFVIGESPEDK